MEVTMDKDAKAAPILLRYLSERSQQKTSTTLTDKYITIRTVINLFPSLVLGDINRGWLNVLDQKLYDKGLKPNTVWKYHKNFKSILKLMYDDGVIDNWPYTNFVTKQFPGDRVLVTQNDIEQLEGAEVPQELRLYRDLFLVSYYTLLRFSDLHKATYANVEDNGKGKILPVMTEKTTSRVIIPVGDKLEMILKRVNGSACTIGATRLNKGVKQVFEAAGITREINVFYVDEQNGAMVKKFETARLCDVVTIHCARRGGVTQLVKSGVPTQFIMKLTGHRTEEALQQYIKISEEENAEKLSTYEFFK